jgi:hypothetical protein
MIPAFSATALYAKSKAYIGRAFRAAEEKDFEEQQLWSSLALELLGKAALANKHPALIADPQHHPSLLAACDVEIGPDVRTISAHTLFPRLAYLNKQFDARMQRFCEQMALRRNAEIHSGESPFSGMEAEVWLGEFWGVVAVLLHILDQSLDNWVGAEGAKVPKEILERKRQAIAHAVKDKIERAREAFQKANRSDERKAAAYELAAKFDWWKERHTFQIDADSTIEVECPACTFKSAIILGIHYLTEITGADPEDPFYETVEEWYSSDEYYCPACKLHLWGQEELSAAKIESDFYHLDVRERTFEPDYMNE